MKVVGERLTRVLSVDILEYGGCGGGLREIASIHPPDTTREILDCLGLSSRTSPLSPIAQDSGDYF